jgi:hypothetical protein
MDERPREPAPEPGERIERREVVERSSPAGPVRESPPPRPAATPMWLWIFPLVLVVIVLVWFILTRAEPRSPVGEIREVEIETPTVIAPEVNLPSPPTIEVQPAPSPSPAPAEPPAAGTPADPPPP